MKFSNKFQKLFLIFFFVLIISYLTSLNQFSLAINVDNSVQVAADTHKILLDSEAEVIYEIEQSGKNYYVTRYSNALPFASGLEIIFKDGTLVSSSNQAKSVFTAVAWSEAAKKLTSSDIQTLNNILLVSNEINNAVSPVYSATGSVLDKVDKLKNFCRDFLLVEICAWDVVISGYPQISQLESALRLLNKELGEWNKAATDVNKNLPNVITGLEKLRGSGELDPMLQADIKKSISSFSTLESKTNQMVDRLSGISTTLSTAESSLKSLSNKPLVGNFISTVADFVGRLNTQVISLKNDAQSFSNTITTQSKNLAVVTDFAEKRTNELFASWNARQTAASSVYVTIVGIVIAVAIIASIIVIFGKKRKAVVKQVAVSSTKFCRKCGTPLPKTGKFCRKCGKSI